MVGLAAEFLRAPTCCCSTSRPTTSTWRPATGSTTPITTWPGTIVVVSHDRVLLDLVDRLAELPDGRIFGGGLTAYTETLEVEQEAAERMVRAAEGDLRREKRDLVEAHEKLTKRAQDTPRRPSATLGLPKHRGRREETRRPGERRQAPHHARTAARRGPRPADRGRGGAPRRRRDPHRPAGHGRAADPDGAGVPARRHVRHRPGRLGTPGSGAGTPRPGTVGARHPGPERIALLGPNGSGKTTLLEAIAGWPELVPTRYLPQRLDVLDERVSIAANVRAVAPDATENEIRAGLARFLFRGNRGDQIAGTLSGGERFRAALARLLFAQPQLLLLDEPTNNLDLASVRQLAQALTGYRGALIVASHDLPFLDSIGITRRLDL